VITLTLIPILIPTDHLSVLGKAIIVFIGMLTLFLLSRQAIQDEERDALQIRGSRLQEAMLHNRFLVNGSGRQSRAASPSLFD
jgi:hypothetical protein